MAHKQNFIILIGGPGKFQPCDREHDKTWSDYIVPIQVAFQKRQIDLAKNEQSHWWVYAPAYQERWDDDEMEVSKANADKKYDRGRNLTDNRENAIARVKKSGANDYLDRIRHVAGTVHARFLAIKSPNDFWREFETLPAGSVSRLWYIGHASQQGLMLKLIHNESCQAAADPRDMIMTDFIHAKTALISTRLASKGKPSKFYGCYTNSFAKQWNEAFGAAAEGAIMKIDFGLVDQPSKIEKVLPRLQATAGWQSYSATDAE